MLRLPPPSLPVARAPLLAVDLEMTGLDAASDEIVSVGWVAIDAGAIALDSAVEHRVACGRVAGVGASATIHGLRDCDLAGAGALPHALGELLAALEGRIAVFHHAPLDIAFVDRACRAHLQRPWPSPWIDTLEWFRRRMHRTSGDAAGLRSATLAAACSHFGLPPRAQHGALADALSCAELLLALAGRGDARLVELTRFPNPRDPGSSRA